MGGILLALFLILYGLGALGVWSAPAVVMGLLALGAGVFMLAPIVVRVGR